MTDVCMERETSATENENEFRARLGLQFFAESGEEGGAEGADMDDAGMDGFLDGLGAEENGGAEDQRAAEGAAAGEAEPGSADQTAGQAANGDGETLDGSEPPQGGDVSTAPVQEQQETPPVTLQFMDQQFTLPGDAVQAISDALGADARTLLQKGMNYDNKAVHELGVLERYAALGGMDLAGYVAYLEKELPDHELNMEMNTLRGQYPGAEDEILREIAQKNIALRRAEGARTRAEQENAAARDAQRVTEVREKIHRQMLEIQQEAERKEWNEYVRAAGITDKSQIPQELIEMVKNEKISPMMAHYKMQAAAARQEAENAKKEAANRRNTPGSLSGGADEHDDFLSGLFG